MADQKLNVLYIFPFDMKPTGIRPVVVSCAKVSHSYHVLIVSQKPGLTTTEKIGDNLTMEPVCGRNAPDTLFKSIRIGLRILRQFDKNHPSVISVYHPFEVGLIGYILSRLTKTPINVELRNDYFSVPFSSHTLWSSSKGLSVRMFYLFGRWLLKRVDSIIAVSGGRLADSLIKFGVKPERIHTLRTAVNIADFTPTSPRNFNKETIEIISAVSHFKKKQKNLPLLVRAFDLAATKAPNLKLTLVGAKSKEDGLNVRKVIKKSKNTDKMSLLPYSNAMPSHLKRADIYALSSDYEGCARVLTEAMASGLPIVTTDVSGVGDVCRQGEHALVVPIGDEEAFAEALVTLAKDKEMRRRFSANSLETTKTAYQTLPEYAASWANILNQMVMKR